MIGPVLVVLGLTGTQAHPVPELFGRADQESLPVRDGLTSS
jgi:hypothetical protein